MAIATHFQESPSQQVEKEILCARFEDTVHSLIGNRLSESKKQEAKSLQFCNLLELVIELECLKGCRMNTKELCIFIDNRIDELVQ